MGLAKHPARSADIIMRLLACPLALAIFCLETFTRMMVDVAALYVVVLILGVGYAGRVGQLVLTSLCLSLAVFSCAAKYWSYGDTNVGMQLTIAIVAIITSAALLVRYGDAVTASVESEGLYRSIFKRTQVAFWELDLSRLRTELTQLKKHKGRHPVGEINLSAHFGGRVPEVVDVIAYNATAADLLGLTDDGRHSKITEFMAEMPTTFIRLMHAITDGEAVFEDLAVLEDKTGERQILFSAVLSNDEHKFGRVIVSMVDITQTEKLRKAVEDAKADLRRASRAATVGALSASISHELNQPLGALTVNSEALMRWLDRDPPEIDAARRTAERMQRDASRASAIIRNSRQMIDQSPQPAEAVDLAELLRETIALMGHELRQGEVSVKWRLESNTPTVDAVRIEIQQVLVNLISNAIQAMSGISGPRKIVVELKHAVDTVEIAIRDTGPGLSDEAKARMFSAFYTTKVGGMGLGLSICRDAIEARGGQLQASNHPGGGAVFKILLPIRG